LDHQSATRFGGAFAIFSGRFSAGLPLSIFIQNCYHIAGFMHIDAYPTGLVGEINLRQLPLTSLLCYHVYVGLLRHGFPKNQDRPLKGR